jgi:sialate O-acetylesterase
MNYRKIAVTFAFLISSGYCHAQIRLPKLIGDGMILQRGASTKLWGWAAPKEKVTLQFNKQSYSIIADEKGNWSIKLPETKAGGPYEMTFRAANEIVVKDILFGDVWVCSGQSNMELPMERLIDKYPAMIANANNQNIRQFLVPDEYDFLGPRQDISNGVWKAANPTNVLSFSGVAYFFALEVYAKNKIPIGIINTALGGSPAEAWISEDALKQFPAYLAEGQKYKDKSLISTIEDQDRLASNKWQSELNAKDAGLKKHWKAPDLETNDWQTMQVPGFWANGPLGQVNGVVWFRKEFNVSKNMVGQSAKLLLGRIVDADSVFINGEFAGTTSYQYPPRRYLLRTGLLKEGKNVIVVRVVNNSGRGGFITDKPYELVSGNESIGLKGEWKYKLGTEMGVAPGQTFVRWKPFGLYNAMIAPLTNYAIKGALWYQGEANTAKPEEYKSLMTALISDWRAKWGLGNFPFLYVQLPGFMDEKTIPVESNWAKLRQQQLLLHEVPNTAMAVAIDLGEWNDIHPLNKQDVGERLALQAQKLVYGAKNSIASGPLFKSVKLDGQQLKISFTNIGGGLVAKNGTPLTYFSVAGEDRKFVWAQAKIVGNEVVVSNHAIIHPVYVRYAWSDNPVGANLFNKANLPASPFEGNILK